MELPSMTTLSLHRPSAPLSCRKTASVRRIHSHPLHERSCHFFPSGAGSRLSSRPLRISTPNIKNSPRASQDPDPPQTTASDELEREKDGNFSFETSERETGVDRVMGKDISAVETLYSDFKLFSNVNQATLQHEPGSLWSAILLVAGTTVGAGILAIPAVTEEAGFSASVLTCIICWFYMVTTGLILAEVNVNTMCELGSGGVSVVSMAERTLGKVGLFVACVTYIFLHYALLVAYVARSSSIMENLLHLSSETSALIFTLLFGGLCCFGNQKVIGEINGGLVIFVVTSFLALVGFSATSLDPLSLLKFNVEGIPKSIPVIMLSFVYQNVVPVVCTNLEGNLPRIRNAIFYGTALPLLMFLIWNAVILGNPLSVSTATLSIDPLARMRATPGPLGFLVDFFSFFAIATSYIGFVLGLSDFLSDLLKLPLGSSGPTVKKIIPFFLTLFPPLVLSMLNPSIFFDALDLAGTYGVLVLFGIIPAAMSWRARSNAASNAPKLESNNSDFQSPDDPWIQKNITPYQQDEFFIQNQSIDGTSPKASYNFFGSVVPGGNATLSIIIITAAFVLWNELLSDLHLL